MQLGRYDLMMLTDTNIPDEAYFHNHLGYGVMWSQTVGNTYGGSQEGVGLVTRERTYGWSVDSMRFYGPNVLRCEVVLVGQKTPLIGA